MKKNLKRTLAKVMAVALTVALAGTAAPDADAAKKIKLSSKSITVVKGKTKKVTIKNVKKNQVKKLTVKSNKTKVATVKKSGKTALKVTGKKAGSAKITVSVTKKGAKKATKLTLKVKVQNAATPTTPVESAAPTAAVTAAPATTAPAAPGTSDNPSAPGTSGNPAGPGTSDNPVGPGTSGNPAGPGTSGNPAGPGTSGNPATPTPTPATPTPVPDYETTSIENIQLGGQDADKVMYFECKDGVADLILTEKAQYGNVYMYFDVTMPDDTTIDDIKKITYDIEGVSGDRDWKTSSLVVGSPDAGAIGEFPDYFDISAGEQYDSQGRPEGVYNVIELYKSGSYGSVMTGVHSEEVEIDVEKIKENVEFNKTLRFSVHMNLDGVENGVNTEYKISNIKVYSTKDKAMADGNETPGATIDNTDDVDPVAAISFGGKTRIAAGTTESATVSISNAGIVGDIKSIAWTSSDDEKATVEANEEDASKGDITGVAAGKVTITGVVTTTKDKTATVTLEIEVTEGDIEIKPATLTVDEKGFICEDADKQYWNAKRLEFSAMTGYPEGFAIADYATVKVTLKAYEDAEGTTPATVEASGDTLGKVALGNATTGAFGNGVGNKEFMAYIGGANNLASEDDGTIVVTFEASKNAEAFVTADSITAQLMSTTGTIKRLDVVSVEFMPAE